MWLLALLASCYTSTVKHTENKTINGTDYQCLCERTEETEPVCGTEETKYCDYKQSYECKCKEIIQSTKIEYEKVHY